MEAARANLRLVTEAGDFPWPGTGELVPVTEAHHRILDMQDKLDGYKQTVDKQARDIGVLNRRITEEEDPNSHPKGKEIVALIERWRTGANHPSAKISADRVKLVKARIKDTYPIRSDDPLPAEPTLELAVDGICSHPFVVNGQRVRNGTAAQRHDRLGIALGGGEKVEEFARLGYAARKQGWTPEGGWKS